MTTPFDTSSLYALAQELAYRSSDEVRLRTAVNRAYYAVFLLAREKARIRGTHDVHVRVIEAVRQRKGQNLANLLFHLKRLRTVADYQITPIRTTDQDWQQNWRYASSIVRRLLPEIEAW
jgi:uncharacterized protein (UPF0332 family)